MKNSLLTWRFLILCFHFIFCNSQIVLIIAKFVFLVLIPVNQFNNLWYIRRIHYFDLQLSIEISNREIIKHALESNRKFLVFFFNLFCKFHSPALVAGGNVEMDMPLSGKLAIVAATAGTFFALGAYYQHQHVIRNIKTLEQHNPHAYFIRRKLYGLVKCPAPGQPVSENLILRFTYISARYLWCEGVQRILRCYCR